MQPQDADPRRDQLMAAWRREAELKELRGSFLLGIGVQTIWIVSGYLMRGTAPEALLALCTFSVVLCLNFVGCRFVRDRKHRAGMALIFACSVLTNLGMVGILYMQWTLYEVVSSIMALTACVSFFVCFLSLVSNPYTSGMMKTFSGIMIAAWIPGPFLAPLEPSAVAWLCGFPISVLLGYGIRRRFMRVHDDTALREYERLSEVTPAAIIDTMIRNPQGGDGAFRPARRSCVCICSDWRGYQKMTAGMGDDQVVAALEHFYNAVDALLIEAFPRGNFFSDWIADELFVVTFAIEGVADVEMARQATGFAAMLVERRSAIAAQWGVPKALDVGLSMGTASVGIMGSRRHRKATALGATPGRARRLQTFGKRLREIKGSTDRVLLESTLAALVAEAFPLSTFELGRSETIADVEARVVHYLEPKPARTALALAQ